MQIRDIMNPIVVSITPEESAALAARLLARHDLGALPVCGEDGGLRGIVTDRDIITRCIAPANDPASTPVRDIMTRGVEVISPAEDITSAAQRMAGNQVRRLPVVEHDKVVGMVSLGDLARRHCCDMETAQALSEISENVRHTGKRGRD